MIFERDFNELLLIASSLIIIFGFSRYALHFISTRRGESEATYSLLNFSGFVLIVGFILYLALNWWSHQSFPQSGQRYVVTNSSAFVAMLALVFGINAQRFAEKPIRIFKFLVGVAVIVGASIAGISWVVYEAYN